MYRVCRPGSSTTVFIHQARRHITYSTLNIRILLGYLTSISLVFPCVCVHCVFPWQYPPSPIERSHRHMCVVFFHRKDQSIEKNRFSMFSSIYSSSVTTSSLSVGNLTEQRIISNVWMRAVWQQRRWTITRNQICYLFIILYISICISIMNTPAVCMSCAFCANRSTLMYNNSWRTR